jgi:branched-chain amino acid transport system ATP-binding protein
MTLLRTDAVSKRFGGVEAVAGLTLAIEAGRITGLIGPNGAGKTTMVNLITGLLQATSGRILLRDEDITALPANEVARRGVSRTFQNIRLLKEATVLDNIVVGYHILEKTGLLENLLGLPAARRERRTFGAWAVELIKRFRMERYQDHLAGSLSYGHQRRVEMMRALAMNPKLLLLDEPVAGMNDVEAGELGAIFQQLAGEGIGVLLIEHNMRFVMSHSEQIYVVIAGRLIASGTPEVVSNDPTVISAYLGEAISA